MRWMQFLGPTLAATLAVSAVDAATVKSVNGRVLLNKGDGFKEVVGETSAAPGTRVMAAPGGRGQIIYPNGCVVHVNPPAVETVEAVSPCQAVAIGDGGGGPKAGGPGAARPTGALGTGGGTTVDPAALAVALGVGGAGIAAAVLISQNDNSASD